MWFLQWLTRNCLPLICCFHSVKSNSYKTSHFFTYLSHLSTSLKPMYAMSLTDRHGLTHSKPGIYGMYSFSSCTRNDSTIPWRFPEGEQWGTLMSAWASTHTTHISGSAWQWPWREPMVRLWSPPRATTASSCSVTMLHTVCESYGDDPCKKKSINKIVSIV